MKEGLCTCRDTFLRGKRGETHQNERCRARRSPAAAAASRRSRRREPSQRLPDRPGGRSERKHLKAQPEGGPGGAEGVGGGGGGARAAAGEGEGVRGGEGAGGGQRGGEKACGEEERLLACDSREEARREVANR